MGIGKRVSRLFQADLHGLLDCIEEPGSVVRQALREMTEELERGEATLTLFERQRVNLVERLKELDQRIEDIDHQLTLCFEENDEPLARKMVKRKLELGQLRQRLAASHSELERKRSAQEQLLAEQREKLSTIAEKWEVLRAAGEERETSEGPLHSAWSDSLGVRSEDVEAALLAERRKRQGSASA